MNANDIERLTGMAEHYAKDGCFRKAAFYKRFAALKAVSLHLEKPDWEQCYYLLLSSFDGYNLTLDPVVYQQRVNENSSGWPGIHLQLMQELVTTACRMNNDAAALRHLSFLVHSLFEHLTPNQRKKFATQLLEISPKVTDVSSLNLREGYTMAEVHFTKLPLVTQFKLENLPPHLRPIKLKARSRSGVLASNPPSPFIFTPLQINRSTTNTPRKSLSSAETLNFKWAQDESCQTTIQLHNLLPMELCIKDLQLITEGLEFETLPICLTLPPESSNSLPVKLSGIPKSSGKLEILGYSLTCLGVQSNCRLKELPNAKKMRLPMNYTIDVIPPLPLMQLSSSLSPLNQFSQMPDVNYVIVSGHISLYAGENREFTVTVTNNSTNGELIELINVNVITKSKRNEKFSLTWDKEAINKELPLASGNSFNFVLSFDSVGSFVMEMASKKSKKAAKASSASASMHNSVHNSPMHNSAINIKKSQLGATLANFLSELHTAGNKPKQQDQTVLSNTNQYLPRVVETVLQFEYSGGLGLASGYCRYCALALTIEILPSIYITHWDVLPAEIPTDCFLVLDVLNATNQELELHYTKNKEILIEAKETCRIPVQVERCPLADVENNDKSETQLSLLPSRYKTHLINQVDLKWVLPASSVEGKASIEDVPWDDRMLDAILLSPVQWEVRLNDCLYKINEEFTFSAGELISLSISLQNYSGNSLKSLCLWIQCYQDYQNGHRNYRLDMKRAIMGCDKIFIAEIPAKQSYFHECGFIFFHSGLYKFDIQCSVVDTKGVDMHQKNQEFNTTSPSMWQYTPAIEINIE